MARYTTAQTQSKQIQTNVAKTMVFVSAFFVVTWTPLDVYYLLIMIDSELSLLDNGYYALMSVAFLYICTNPFTPRSTQTNIIIIIIIIAWRVLDRT